MTTRRVPTEILQKSTLRRGPRLAAVGALLGLVLQPIATTRAADAFPSSRAIAALARLHSYQVRLSATSQGALAATFVQTAVVVRAGAQTEYDIVSATRPQGAGDTTISEDVIRGATVCERDAFNAPLPLHGSFTCRRAPGQAVILELDLRPISNVLPATARFSGVYRLGVTTLQHGQRCDAYAYNVHSATANERGTLSLDHTTDVPCTQSATTTGTPVIGLGPGPTLSGTATTTSVTTWSRIDDPTLSIPQTPQ